MDIRNLAALLLALASPALAATTTSVVDIPSRGGSQRILYVVPDAPRAFLVHVPGGDGVFGIQADGSMGTMTATCSPVNHQRQAFAAAGIGIAFVDAHSSGSVREYADILEVVRYVRARHDVPVWIIGGSASTAAVAFAAATLPESIPVGVVFYSTSQPFSSAFAQIRRPAFVVYHSGDSGQFGNQVYNALTAAPVRERLSLSGGTDAGCGFHLFNGQESAFSAAVVSFIDRHNAATAIAQPNYQGLWWRSPAGSESGWGVNITHQSDTLFATWFTYDTDGRGMWLVMSAGTRTAPGAYSGKLYRTTGPAFSATPFNPAQVGVTEVGTGSFTFTDTSNGTFAYTVNGISQSKPITRQVYASPVPECSTSTSAGATPNYQALWWASPSGAESGWGVNITHQGEILFATWFTYDTDGRGMWLVMSGGARTAPGTYSGELYRTTGPAFNTSPWMSSGVVATAVGTATFTFSGADNGTFTYTVGGVTQSKAITRQVYATPATVCR
ncbi:MAG TPA: hypothetical protein VEC19_03045 [Usitatibacter sp.]|nr:hypothetical protein [Usitatibacter sp.]